MLLILRVQEHGLLGSIGISQHIECEMVAASGLIGSSTASAFVLTAGVSAFDSSTGSPNSI